MSMDLLKGRVALVTGASRGIGAAAAKALAAAGAHVILVARNTVGLEAVDDAINAAGGSATLVPVDLMEADKIDQIAVAIGQRFGRMDILVGNAGMLGALYPVTHLPTKTWDQMFATNVTANWRLLRAFDGALRASDAGRAIFVTDSVAHGSHPYWGPYAASKAALEAMVRSYAAEISKSRARISLLDPGPVATNLRAKAFPGEDASTLRQPEDIAPAFVTLASPHWDRQGDLVTAESLLG